MTCFPHAETPAETVRHLFLDQVLPLALTLGGSVVLHASAVALPSGCVAFSGTAGQGKSTLAALLAKNGARLLADDCLLLHTGGPRFFVAPSYPGVRLWRESIEALAAPPGASADVAHYSDKKRVDGWGFCEQPQPLQRIYLLNPGEHGAAVRIARLAPRDALLELFKNSFRLDHTDQQRLRWETQVLARIVESDCCRKLTYHKDFSKLNEIARAVLDDCSAQ